MGSAILYLKKELAGFAQKAAKDSLTVAASGNISARKSSCIYIKAAGVSFEKAGPGDFVRLNLRNPSLKGLKNRPSCEYRLHIACYNKRPQIKSVFHTHPIFSTTLYSAGAKIKPTTMEFALYIGTKGVVVVDFIPPGTKELAEAVGRVIADHNAVIIRKHGLVTVGNSLQEAYLRTLVIEREAKAQFICRLYSKRQPFLTKEEICSLGAL